MTSARTARAAVAQLLPVRRSGRGRELAAAGQRVGRRGASGAAQAVVGCDSRRAAAARRRGARRAGRSLMASCADGGRRATSARVREVLHRRARPVGASRPRRCSRHERSQPTSSVAPLLGQRVELVVGHGDRRLGQLHARTGRRSRSSARRPPRSRRSQPSSAVEQRDGRLAQAQLAQHVAGVVVARRSASYAAPPAARRSAEQLGQLPRRARPPPGPLGGVVVADHLEQLGPEDPDHRGAAAGRHADARRPSVERLERARASCAATWAASSAKPAFHAGWPQHVAPSGDGHLAAAAAQHPHHRLADLRGDRVDHAGRQQRDTFPRHGNFYLMWPVSRHVRAPAPPACRARRSRRSRTAGRW